MRVQILATAALLSLTLVTGVGFAQAASDDNGNTAILREQDKAAMPGYDNTPAGAGAPNESGSVALEREQNKAAMPGYDNTPAGAGTANVNGSVAVEHEEGKSAGQ